MWVTPHISSVRATLQPSVPGRPWIIGIIWPWSACAVFCVDESLKSNAFNSVFWIRNRRRKKDTQKIVARYHSNHRQEYNDVVSVDDCEYPWTGDGKGGLGESGGTTRADEEALAALEAREVERREHPPLHQTQVQVRGAVCRRMRMGMRAVGGHGASRRESLERPRGWEGTSCSESLPPPPSGGQRPPWSNDGPTWYHPP